MIIVAGIVCPEGIQRDCCGIGVKIDIDHIPDEIGVGDVFLDQDALFSVRDVIRVVYHKNARANVLA